MRTSRAVCVLTMLITNAAAGAGPAATGIVDPYGIIIKPIPDKTVVLTFDDACLSHATFVAPLLKRYGFGGTFYITAAFGFKTRKDWYMTWEQIKAVQDMGLEVGNHTINHQSCTAVSVERCLSNVQSLDDLFEKHGLPRATTFCYPMSRVNNDFLPALSERGYLFARAGAARDRKRRPYDPLKDSPLHVPAFGISDNALKKQPGAFLRAAEQAKDGKIVVFTLHGVPDEEHPGCSLEPEKFKELMEYLKKNDFNVISMRDMAQYVDATKAALCLSRPSSYPWGGRALSWGWVNRKGTMLYVGIEQLPADRKLTLPRLTTKIGRAWFLADARKSPLTVSTSDRGIPTIAVAEYPADGYGLSPVIIAAELEGGPVPTILDFVFPGLPEVTMSKDEIIVVVPEATELKSLAPIYKTGSPEVTGEPASGTARDFTGPQTYTITARDGRTRAYTIAVTKKRGAVGAADSSFEQFDSLDKQDGTFGVSPKGAIWVFAQKHKNASVGILSVENRSLAPIPPPDGSRCCGVVGGAGSRLSQSVVFDEGTYTISFDRTIPRRIAGNSYPSLQLTIDGRVLLTLEGVTGERGKAPELEWKTYTSPVFTVTAGRHTISLVVGDDAEPGNFGLRGVNLVDNVRIEHR